MISTWKPKSKYFFIASIAIMEIELPEPIKDDLGYFDIVDGVKVYKAIKFGESVQISRELNDGNFAVSIQLSPNPLHPIHCVADFITESDFNKAVENYAQFGITEFLTLEQFKALDFKQTEILI